MIRKYLVNEQYILETSHWLITSRNEHKMTVNFINPGSAIEVKPDGILVWPLGSNQMESWFGRWGSERVNDYVKDLHSVARSDYVVWRDAGKPRSGTPCSNISRSRFQFKYALRQCRMNEELLTVKSTLMGIHYTEKIVLVPRVEEYCYMLIII